MQLPYLILVERAGSRVKDLRQGVVIKALR